MDARQELKKKIIDWSTKRKWAQKGWSFVLHISLFGSIGCSLAAGAIIQFSNGVDPVFDLKWAPFLTTTAAVLTGITTSGGFERKWRSNRLSRSKADIPTVGPGPAF